MGDKRKAMVIAVSDYSGGLQNLEFCKKDGESVREVLSSLDYDIAENNYRVGIIGGNDMRDTILDFFNDPEIKSEDVVLFYFSGHGVPSEETVFLASSDVDPKFPNKRGFSFDELTAMITRCTSTRVITVLDCCYSGAASLGKGGGDEAVMGSKNINKSMQSTGEGKCLLAASTSYQEAFGMKEGDQSLFTHYFIEGMKGTKESIDVKGNVTPDTLGKYVYNKVTDAHPNQKPIRKVEASGEIILASYSELVDSEKNIDVDTTLDEADNFLKIGEYTKALSSYNLVLQADPKNLKAWNNKGKTYELGLLDYDKAAECYERGIAIDAKDHTIWYNKANALAKAEKTDEALRCYDKALELKPDEPDYWHNKGTILSWQGDSKEAKKCFTKAKAFLE